MATDEEVKEFLPSMWRAQLICELIAFILCLLVTGTQLGILDYYFVLYADNKIWLIWIVGDCLVIGVMCWLFHFAIRYSRRCLKHPCKDEANLKYAFIVWFVYSMVLSGKIATFFPLFAKHLLPSDHEYVAKRELWGPIALKFVLGSSAVIFLLLVLSHHYNRMNNPRASYLSYLSSVITIDLLDSVLFLELLIEPTVAGKLRANEALQIIILILACINFVLPTFSLFKLRYRKGLPSWIPLPYEKLYALGYFLLVNIPYLVIRAYLWQKKEHDVSIFLIKNVIMVAVGLRDVWVGFLQWKEKRALKAHNEAVGRQSSHRAVEADHHSVHEDASSGDRLHS